MKKYRVAITIVIFFLIYSSINVVGININSEKDLLNVDNFNKTTYAIDKPTWNIGDTWKYEIILNGPLCDQFSFNSLKLKNVIYKVEDIVDDKYIMDITGNPSGCVTFTYFVGPVGIPFTGSLYNTNFQGQILVNKNNLYIENILSSTTYVIFFRRRRLHFSWFHPETKKTIDPIDPVNPV